MHYQSFRSVCILALAIILPHSVLAQSTYEQRHAAFYDDIASRKINLGQTDGPHRAGRTGFWTTQGRLQRGMATSNPSKVWNELKATITNADGAQDAGGANGGFSGWPGMDTYMRWQHLMPQEVKDAYTAEYLGMKTYGSGSTPNQRMMWAAACRLACETWGTAAVTTNSNASNRTGEITGKKYIETVCDRTVKYNFDERWAKHYLIYTLEPLRSIADLSTDPVLANKARMTWNWGWMDIASFSFKGRWAIPAGRGGMTQDGNSSDISEFGSWLMFGGTPRANPLDMDQSLNVTQPKVGVPFAVTQPPIIPEMLEAATNRDVPFTRRGMARVHETQWATSYLTKDWTLYSQLEGDTTLNSDGSIKIKDLDNNGVPSNDWSSERWAVMWDETGAAGLTMKPPTGYGWAQGSGLGPHEDVMQHEGTLVGILNIPTTWTWQYTNDNIPTNTTAVINDSATTGRLFLHYSKVLVAITRSDIGNFTWPPAAQTTCNKRGFAVECASLSEYPQATAAERLAAFKADIIAHAADTSHVNDATPRMIYTTRAGKVLDITYGLGGKVDGAPLDYEGWPLNESPWSYQPQMGNMWVFGQNRKLLWNYKTWTESVDNAPTATTTAPVAAAGATPVDVDLSTRIADAETASAALKYRVTGTTNGTAKLLADGKTVRFTPAANFSGASTFSITAGGPFPDHRFVAFYDDEAATIGTDVSTNDRHATVNVGGIASAAASVDVPSALAGASTKSLRLTSGAFGAAKLSRSFFPAVLNFSNHDWTFATWVKRDSYADDDFIFYVGDGDGFGGSGEELQVWLPAQSKTVAVRHYNAANAQTFSIASSAKVGVGEWHHVAVQFVRSGYNTGVVKLYLDGELTATSASVTWALKQAGPVFIGGPAQNTVLTRGFSGWLDDTVLARGDLGADEITQLATAGARFLGGAKLAHTITVNSAVLAPSGLSATAGNSAVSLAWGTVGGATSYTVKRGTASSGPFITLTTSLSASSYTDATAVPGTTYFYVVTATNGAGESANSNVASTALPVSDATIWASGTMNAWSHGARIAFPGYSGSETLANFPMLVRLDATNVPGFSYAQMAFANGADLRFTDANGVELSYEIESWNPSGTSLVWVRVPSLVKGGSIIAYWGNPTATATTTPNSLSGLAMWLKADALALTDGATVSTWVDSSPNARNATLAQGTPVFKTAQVNGKPVVRFTGDGESSLTFPTMTNIRTVFWVVKETAAAPHFLLGDDNTYHFHRGTGGNMWDANYASANVRNGTTKLNGAAVNGTTTPLGAGWRLVSLVTAGNCEASRLSRDRNIAARSWDGDVAEVIVYDRALTANEELLIGGYLAQKYALPTAYAGAAPGYTSDGSTWSGGFTGVWHLNSANVIDSTTAPQNTTSNATVTSGIVGSALLHDGASQHAIIPNATDTNVVNNFELSGWFKMAPGDKTNWRTLWTKETDSATRNWWISVNGSGQVWWTSSAGTDIMSTSDLADNQWHYVSAVNDGSYSRLYIDGVQVGSDNAASEEQTTWAVRLGSENATRWWKGSLDEFRISNVKRSATWVRATFDNISAATWARSGNVTPRAAGYAPMVSTRAATSVGTTTATLNGNLAATGGSTTTVILYHGATDGGTNPSAWAGSLNLGARSVGSFSGNISGLTSGSTRYCRAFASNATGSTWAAETVSFVTDTAAPTGLVATPGNGLVNLTWTATPGATTYQLKRSTAAGGPFTTLLSNILTPAAADTSAVDGTTYFYVVSAINAGGESANSAAVSVATLAAPTDLIATAGNASVALNWSAVSGATSYALKRATTSSGTYTTVQSGIVGTTFTDTTAVNGTSYFYIVTASNALFESDISSEATATPSANVATPTGLSGTPDDASALLSWNAVAGATHYRVKRATTSGGPYTTVGDPVYAPSFTNTGLTNGTPYFFVVSALNGSVESGNSAQVTVTPGPLPTTFTTASAGTWSAATWSPQQPFSGFQTTITFNNASAISSTANLGTLIANKLNLTNAAVTLSGDSLFFLGTAPGITTTANVAHSIANNLTLDGASTMNIAQNTTTLSGILNGNGGITKTGAGTLVLTGANTNTGGTAVNAGALNIRHANALGSGDVSVASGAGLELQGGITVSGARATLTGSGTTNGALRNVSGNNEWAGDISAVSVSGVTRVGSDAGTLKLSGEISLSAASTSDQFVIQGNGATVVSGVITGTSRVTRSNSGTGVVSLIGDNTYTGQTLLNGGVTEVESISSLVGDPGDEEVALNASGLGAPTTVANGTITMGFSSTTATLRFIGPSLKTDRVIALAGTSGGATIEQNGTGTLTLLSAFTATGAGTKTLTFSGTGNGVATGAIVDNSATNKTNVAKSGSGTWTLGGASTYTGTTTVSAGTLLMTGSIAAGGNVTIASGATFGGSGTVTPNTTVNGNLALNGTLNFGGTLSFGTGARIKTNVADNSTAAGNAVAATTTVSTGAVVDVTLNGSSSLVDFSNAFWSTARSWPIVTAASRTGNFTLGTVSSDIAARPASGYGTFTISQTATAAVLVWTPLTPIEQWRFTNFGSNANTGIAADNADPDGDGVTNFAEFNGGSNPNDALSVPTFIFNNVAGGNWSNGVNWNTAVAPVSNAALAVEAFTGQTLAGTIAVTNDLAGTLTLNSLKLGGTGSGTVATNFSGGSLQFVANGANAPFIQLAASSSNVTVNVANNITLGADVTLQGTNSGNFHFSGTISGAGGITRTDSYSTVTLSGTNTYTGATVLQSGITAISAAANFGAASAPLTLDGGTLRLNGTTLASMSAMGRTVTFAPDKTVTFDIATSTHNFTCDLVLNQVSGGLVKNGAGVLTLTQPNTFQGATTLNSGTLAVSAGEQLGLPAASLVFNGGTLRINGTTLTGLADLGRSVTFTATKTVSLDVADATNTFEVAQTLDQTTGGLTKLGAGTLQLNTANTFTGSVTVSAGALRISQAAALGGASKSVFCTTGIARLELDGAGSDITIPATTTVLTSGAQTTGALRNMSGNNTLVGPLLLTTGAGHSQILSDGGTLTLAGNITTSPTAGARTLQLGGTASGLVSGNIADNGTNIVSVTKNGSGTWELRGANTYTGATTLSAGRLALSGSFTSAITATTGTLTAYGTPSTTSHLSINSGGRFEVQLDGTAVGTQYDQLTVGGSVTLAGALDIIAAPGLAAGSVFTIVNKTSAGAISGTFAGKANGSWFSASGYVWQISYTGGDGNDITLTVAKPQQAWRFTHFGTGASTGTSADLADPNGDGENNLLEFATAQSPSAATTATAALARNGAMLEFTYARANAALADGFIFSVEWSNTLNGTDWSTSGVTQQILSDNGTMQTVKASVSAGSTRRFLRLNISKP